ncbi:uncharacterized protein LOC122025512 [Zingiber officinale]|uniref:Uncharacterized protein n=1 Tax=Zingiber officinale TaxID=94328 RepID=A0A8J5K715_ZINOF|nr:uncharacterized protein LOC122025512 [Zingiber officinale]KAG6476024.1 hypothetical protein ZIOFF_065259 [Zingiber officinale]
MATTMTQVVCCYNRRLLRLSLPSSSTQTPSGSRRRSFPIPRAAFPYSMLRWERRSFSFGKVSGGRSKVFSYLPDSEKSNGAADREANSSNFDSDTRRSSVVSKGSSSIARSESNGKGSFGSISGKSGSASFCGLTHQTVEERKLASPPLKDGTGSLVWVLGPLALISSAVLPQFFLRSVIESVLRDEVLSEIVASLSAEIIFYAGLAAFLSITDHVQRPYLEFSPKRWSLITGLRGYLSYSFFTMGFKIFAPLLAAYVVWPVIGLPAVVAVTPFLLGCAVQYAFEIRLTDCNSSCWPTLPIIFEVYRLYQLSKAANFMERLMFLMRDASTNSAMERSSALISMLAVFQVLGVVCLWSLVTFLLRLFPSRPVAENY